MPDPVSVDPNAWADAVLRVFNGGGWVIPALLALYIVMRWGPWSRRKDGGS